LKQKKQIHRGEASDHMRVMEASLRTGILYKSLQGDMQQVTWMRPITNFHETVKTADRMVPRFLIVEDIATAPARP
jgi:hypothetical protein